MQRKKYNDIDQYIDEFPKEVQQKLQSLRTAILAAAPKATEVISYNMPAFRMNRVLVYFAAYKNHIGFYPAPAGLQAFEKELAPYLTGKGTAQFPIDKPLPLGLITQIVKFRVKQNLEKAEIKRKK